MVSSQHTLHLYFKIRSPFGLRAGHSVNPRSAHLQHWGSKHLLPLVLEIHMGSRDQTQELLLVQQVHHTPWSCLASQGREQFNDASRQKGHHIPG